MYPLWLAEGGTKVCRLCFEPIPLDQFGRSRGAWDGRDPRCLPCKRVEDRERRKDPGARHREQARKAVSSAVHSGMLEREPCLFCGSADSQAHHHSYRSMDWLNITWLCQKHHYLAHQAPPVEAQGHLFTRGWDLGL
jgi:hypothetical protein